MTTCATGDNNLDTGLYSRQLYVYGKDGMKNLSQANILISNINGLGLEIAKCIILAGVNSVTLHDTNNIIYYDLGTHYYASEKNIGQNRAEVSLSKLQELNSYVSVNVSRKNIEEIIKNYSCVVLVDYNIQDIISINNITRPNNINLVSCSTNGLWGQIFCDFNNFYSSDLDGESIKTGIIIDTKITKDNQVILMTHDNHKLAYNDSIKINNNIYNISKIISPREILIKSNNNNLINQKFEQIKSSQIFKFQSFEDELKNPNIVFTDFNIDKLNILHVFYQVHNNKNIIQEMKKINNSIDYNKYEVFINKLIKSSQGKLTPLVSIIGSISAQEVIKASMNKYTPLFQSLYFEALDCLPDNYLDLPEEEFTKLDSRYDSQILTFGKNIQEKINQSNIFIVGSGAIGCEHLKNFAMMGTNLVITDMDTIERSNLNRQFLFRSWHINKSKSMIAAEETSKINNNIKIKAHQYKVCEETKHIYDNDFFNSIDCVANALDNIPARLYVDSLCVTYKKYLLESGTLGTSGNTQAIIPYLTESYGSQRDPPEESVPVCTIKNFPYLPEHCIQWSREIFEEEFKIKVLEKKIYDMKSIDDCATYAIELWNNIFYKNIIELTEKYPIDLIQENIKFWSGTKKYPNLIKFDNSDINRDFILITTKLISSITNTKFEEFKITDSIINKKLEISNNTFNNLEFDKDNDLHMKFISLCTNIRSQIYSINILDDLEIKRIAGKIIPAIATSTSLVSGLVSLELYKVLLKKNKIEDYRNYYFNLALSYFQFTEPGNAKKNKIKNLEYTLWDTEEFKDTCLNDIIDYYSDKYDIDISGFMLDRTSFLTSYMNPHKKIYRKKQTFGQIYEEIFNKAPNYPLLISLIIEKDDSSDLSDDDESRENNLDNQEEILIIKIIK
jgi:ubiquitin-activating enzyme E1